jgi:hypothetical protein
LSRVISFVAVGHDINIGIHRSEGSTYGIVFPACGSAITVGASFRSNVASVEALSIT